MTSFNIQFNESNTYCSDMLLTFCLMLRVFDKKINVQDTQTNKNSWHLYCNMG